MTYDNDEETLEIYPQPTKLKISYRHLNGKKVTFSITPDVFLIQKSGFVFTEGKTEEELKKLAEASPNRYMVDEEGRWRSPPPYNPLSLYRRKPGASLANDPFGCLYTPDPGVFPLV